MPELLQLRRKPRRWLNDSPFDTDFLVPGFRPLILCIPGHRRVIWHSFFVKVTVNALGKGLTYRAIADLCGCSHGSVHAEVLAMKKDDEAKKLLEEQEKTKKLAEEAEAISLGVQVINPLVEDSTKPQDFTYYETVD